MGVADHVQGEVQVCLHLSATLFYSSLPLSHSPTHNHTHTPSDTQGQHFTPYGDHDYRVYLMGNPVIYALNLIILLAAGPLLLLTPLVAKALQVGDRCVGFIIEIKRRKCRNGHSDGWFLGRTS